ncbi:hypothetical protein FNO01nite_30050 [Flavobacterium noncentrifugens]|nr:hypothetical protein FNO01nite_30050 [Flavobacterium noncentrifugens]
MSVNEFQKQGHLGTRQVRNVCKKCNEGWMSEMEQKAQSMISEMIAGNSVTLAFDDCHTLANWVTMTMIMAEYIDTFTQAIPVIHRHFLYEFQMPPTGWKIWIGNFSGKDWKFRYRHATNVVTTVHEAMLHSNGKRKLSPNVQFSTMVIGKFIFHCASGPELLIEKCQWNDEWGLTKIWPIAKKKCFVFENKIIWPSKIIINDMMALAISEHLSKQMTGKTSK